MSTNRLDDAKQLVQYAREHLPQIEEAYNASLSEKEIKPKLLIEIKNLMENLRSALDFTARGLFLKYGSSKASDPRIYFPYASLTQSEDQFRKSGRIDACIPGLTANRPDIVTRIESYQHFADPRNKWLPVFMELNNENKHQQLTPQIRRETKELRISSGGASISMGSGASISIGPGASIQIGGMTIPGGQTFDANRPPTTIGPGKKEVITWVSFHFSTSNEPVLPLLKQTLEGVERIVHELSAV
jgi:hypothetical protein